ncbi:hypothetical protein F5882DRAFT_79866 [Hyaloscypha sp. PMI_1271]|nr:hypothetical protein F5882DRAFT_79866 [Hyaloscypha sp. PMI_1271]
MIHTACSCRTTSLRSVRRSLVTAVAGVWRAAPLPSILPWELGPVGWPGGQGLPMRRHLDSGWSTWPCVHDSSSWNPGQPKTPKTSKTHLRLSFPPVPTRRRSFFGVGAVIPSDRLQAVASISRKPIPLLVDPTPKRAGVAVRAVLPATVATRQPMASQRRSGISSWKRDGLEVGGVFF